MSAKELEARIKSVESKSTRLKLSCAGVSISIRHWPGAGPHPDDVLLVHGGSGSWTHWFRNIEHLTQHFNVYAIDLPGLGDSAELNPGYSAEDAVRTVSLAIDSLPDIDKFHIVAFSWGCAVSAQLARIHKDQLLSLMLIGPASIGDIPRRGLMKPLIKRHSGMSDEEVFSANKENLARLMIHQRARIDDMAVYIQTLNTNRARFNSPQFARSRLVLDGVSGMSIPLKVIYGEHDAPAQPNVDSKEALFQAVKPDVDFQIIPDAGHWLQYERSDVFNGMCEEWLSGNSGEH